MVIGPPDHFMSPPRKVKAMVLLPILFFKPFFQIEHKIAEIGRAAFISYESPRLQRAGRYYANHCHIRGYRGDARLS